MSNARVLHCMVLRFPDHFQKRSELNEFIVWKIYKTSEARTYTYINLESGEKGRHCTWPWFVSMMGHPGLREVFFCCLLRGALGAGYIGTRPATQNKCHYEDVREAHFSYARGFCEGKSILIHTRSRLVLDNFNTQLKRNSNPYSLVLRKKGGACFSLR